MSEQQTRYGFSDEELTALEKIDIEAKRLNQEVRLLPGSLTALTSAIRYARTATRAAYEDAAQICDQAEERSRANKLYPAYGLDAFAIAAKEIAAAIRARAEVQKGE